MEDLLTRDFESTARLILEIVVDPASRPLEALLIFGILVAILVMLLLVVLLFITGRSDDEESEVEFAEDEVGLAQLEESDLPGDEPLPEIVVPIGRRWRLPAGVVVVISVLGWWLATGLMTGSTPVCLSCHDQTNHALSEIATDPHQKVRCVQCHDGGTQWASWTTAVPRRVEHIASSLLNEVPSGSYGALDRSCASCHSSDIQAVTENETKAVRMSHSEPIAAGAACLDCHRISDGVIGVATNGMQPCLRCHDDVQASADCESCHTGDIALAVVGRSEPTTATAQPLVREIDCGGCHSQTSCDSCHGIRMPHTEEFKAYAHAREGVEDLWYNNGRACGKCHSDGNKPCTSCHEGEFLSHGSDFRAIHATGVGTGCDTCHGAMSYRPGRDFCGLCH